MSQSIGEESDFDVVKTFINNVINFLTIGPDDNLVGKIKFARHATIQFHVQEHTNEVDLKAAVDNCSLAMNEPDKGRIGTNMPEALNLMRTAGRSGGDLMFRDDDTVTKVAVFITDGRPNTKDLNGDSIRVASQKTEDAAARLHESGIYDQIYAIGIEGRKKIKELEFIASDPSLMFTVEDFRPGLFEELQRNLTNIICGRKYILKNVYMYHNIHAC